MPITPIQTEDAVLFDVSEHEDIRVSTCDNCGGVTFSNKMNDVYYATVSRQNTAIFNSVATASFVNGKMQPDSIKIFCNADSDHRPQCFSQDIVKIMEDIQKFYNAYKGPNAKPLPGFIKEQIGDCLLRFYNNSRIKTKCEDVMWSTFPTRVYQDKQFGPILEKWTNLRYPTNEYDGKKGYQFKPYLSMVMRPNIMMCPDGASKITVRYTNRSGFTREMYKSAVITVNQELDFGYTLDNIVSLEDLESSSYADWDGYLKPQYQNAIFNLMAEARSTGDRTPLYYPSDFDPNGANFRIQLSSSQGSLAEVQICFPIGAGPEFGQNWFYTPTIVVKISPNAWAAEYSRQRLLAKQRRDAAEAQRAANLTAITTPNPPVPAAPTPTTPVYINPNAPVVVPPAAPVNPNITNPVNNAAPDGTIFFQGGVYDGRI